jgi:hypothetical protein
VSLTKGEKRPADVIGAAVMVGRIATRLTNQHPNMRGKTIQMLATHQARWK